MKKILLTLVAVAISATSMSAVETVKKSGFLTTDYCLKRDYFTNCKLENYQDPKQKLVLYVHDEQDFYYIDASKIEKSEMDEGFARDNVSFTGTLTGKTIHATKYDGPPPPAKSFFKGCL